MSINAAGTQAGNGMSFDPVFSPDGTRLAFVSFSSDLGFTDTNGTSDVFVRDLATGVTTLVSVNAAGTQAGNGWSSSPVFSPDGTKIAFGSEAADLGPTDTNRQADIYVRDLSTLTTLLVSATSDGAAGGARVPSAVFGPDGTKIAFATEGNLLPEYDWSTDASYWSDVYVRDLSAQTTTLVSIDVVGTKTGDNHSYGPVFSPDGTTIAFTSNASDLVTIETPASEDVYVRNLETGTTSLVSVGLDGVGAGATGVTQNQRFSPDGATLYFTSRGTNLVTIPDANAGNADVFARDLTTGTTTLVTTNEDGTASGNGGSGLSYLSQDGTKLAFSSRADDLGPTDTNGLPDAYVRDLVTGTTTLVSAAAGGGDSGNAPPSLVGISADGNRVAFLSYANNLGPHDSDDIAMPEPAGDDTGNQDVYVRDLVSGTTTMVSTNAAGTDSANGSSFDATFSPDGSRLAFVTFGTDLGHTDMNEGPRGTLEDIYLATFHGADLSVTVEADGATVTPGGTITYRVELANTGPDTAEAAVVGVVLPDQTELGAVQATGATCTTPDPTNPELLVCAADSLPPGARADATITVTATAAAPSTLTAQAAATSETLDPNTTDNTARVDVSVVDEVA